jgi:hypothetical protein
VAGRGEAVAPRDAGGVDHGDGVADGDEWVHTHHEELAGLGEKSAGFLPIKK